MISCGAKSSEDNYLLLPNYSQILELAVAMNEDSIIKRKLRLVFVRGFGFAIKWLPAEICYVSTMRK